MSGASSRPDVVVVGAGVIGLVTAYVLRERGMSVEVWTRDEPSQTTSAVAAAIWYPFLAEPRARCLQWGQDTFAKLVELARQRDTGVRMQRVVEVFATEDPDLWWADQIPGIARLTGADVPAGFRAAVAAEVPVCEVPIHMRWLLAALDDRGVSIETREIRSLDEASAAAHIVVNCTGLGARELCDDRELCAVRGQVLRLPGASVPCAWIDDTRALPCYVIPRSDGLIVGGTAQHGVERRDPDPADTDRILADARRAFPELASFEPDLIRVGLRPYRSTVRLESVDLGGGRRLVHNYGHGGSGYTLAWGCAEDVARFLTG